MKLKSFLYGKKSLDRLLNKGKTNWVLVWVTTNSIHSKSTQTSLQEIFFMYLIFLYHVLK